MVRFSCGRAARTQTILRLRGRRAGCADSTGSGGTRIFEPFARAPDKRNGCTSGRPCRPGLPKRHEESSQGAADVSERPRTTPLGRLFGPYRKGAAGKVRENRMGNNWRGWLGSNQRPLASEANTLSTELRAREKATVYTKHCAKSRSLKIRQSERRPDLPRAPCLHLTGNRATNPQTLATPH